jgi:mRNA-degrading endonuclease RelE of RelBE toxin-antitoxin system
MTYDIAFHPEAKKELDSLDGRVRIVVLKQLNKLMNNLVWNLDIKQD